MLIFSYYLHAKVRTLHAARMRATTLFEILSMNFIQLDY